MGNGNFLSKKLESLGCRIGLHRINPNNSHGLGKMMRQNLSVRSLNDDILGGRSLPDSWQDPRHGKGTEVLVDGVQGPGLACRENKAWPTVETSYGGTGIKLMTFLKQISKLEAPSCGEKQASYKLNLDSRLPENIASSEQNETTFAIIVSPRITLGTNPQPPRLHSGIYSLWHMVWYDDMMCLM